MTQSQMNYEESIENERITIMVQLNKKEITELRRLSSVLTISDAKLQSIPTPNLIAKEAAKRINDSASLPEDSIIPQELHVTQERELEVGATKFTFRWEPSLEHFFVGLLGGPRDGELIQIPENQKGALEIMVRSDPAYLLEPDQIASMQTGVYRESGWDTDHKKWVYLWNEK